MLAIYKAQLDKIAYIDSGSSIYKLSLKVQGNPIEQVNAIIHEKIDLIHDVSIIKLTGNITGILNKYCKDNEIDCIHSILNSLNKMGPYINNTIDTWSYNIELQVTANKLIQEQFEYEPDQGTLSILQNQSKEKLLLLTIGSSGDILPYITMYDALTNVNIICVLCTHYDHKSLIGSRHFIPIDSSSQECTKIAVDILTGNMLLNSINGINYYKSLVKSISKIFNVTCNNMKGVISSQMTPMGNNIAKYFNCKLIWSLPFPWLPIKYNNHELLSQLTGNVSDVSHGIKEAVMQQVTNEELKLLKYDDCITNDTRCDPKQIIINTFNGQLLDKLDFERSQNHICVGSLSLNNKITGNTKLLDNFLRPSRECILITFGSLPNVKLLPIIEEFANSLLIKGYKIVINMYGLSEECVDIKKYGKVRLNFQSEDVILVGKINYTLYMPKFCAVVMHGGSGTYHHVLKSQVIPIIWPIFGDQFVWAASATSLKLGPTRNTDTFDVSGVLPMINDFILNNLLYKQKVKNISYEIVTDIDKVINTVKDEFDLCNNVNKIATLPDLQTLNNSYSIQLTHIKDVHNVFSTIHTDNYETIYDNDLSTVTFNPETTSGCVNECLKRTFTDTSITLLKTYAIIYSTMLC
jgi:UDP:flavonoid glycosyltransferase YjiC (YdhE family)